VEVPALSAEGICHWFANRKVLDDVTLHAQRGSITGILGPNGSGKTTLLRVLLGILVPARGELQLGGVPYSSYRKEKDRPAFARQVALVPQDVSVTFPFRVREVVLLGRLPHLPPPGFFPSPARLGLARPDDEARAEEAMAACDLSALAERPLVTLSGGERRRVFLARALAQDASVLLLDEPTGALDVAQQLTLLGTLRRLAAGGRTIVMVAHDLALVDGVCDQLLLLRQGRPVASGTCADVLTEANLAATFELDIQIAKAQDRNGRERRVFLPGLPSAPRDL